MSIDPVNVIGQHTVPKVQPHTVARRALKLRSCPIFHDLGEVGVEALGQRNRVWFLCFIPPGTIDSVRISHRTFRYIKISNFRNCDGS